MDDNNSRVNTMKDNEVCEVLEDGTIHYFDTDVCDKHADKALRGLLRKEGKVMSFDFTASVYSLFIQSVEILTQSGWSTSDLLGEVVSHSCADDIEWEADDEEDDSD